MSKAKYYRKGNRIRTPEGTKKYKSINAAKRASRELQLKADGALGRGSLVVLIA